MTTNNKHLKQQTREAFKAAPSLHPLVVGHMCKQDKRHLIFNRRYFALYDGGLLAYYNHEKDFTNDVKRHQGVVNIICNLAFSISSNSSKFLSPQPLHCRLVKLDGMYLTRPKIPPHGAKHCFTLHAPEKSNHRRS